jgi:hypothetical protein
MTETTVSIRVISFSGKFEDWPYWSVKFLTRAHRKGYRDVLLGYEVTPSDDEKPVDTAAQADIDKYTKARELNDLAFEEMCPCIDVTTKPGKVAFGCINGARTGHIKLGCAREAWKRLNNKYEPKTAPGRLRLHTLFQQCELRPGQDPDEWITSLRSYMSVSFQRKQSWMMKRSWSMF